MSLRTMDELLAEQLDHLYAAEKHTIEMLPKLAGAASDPKLADFFRQHEKKTREHVTRLDEVFKQLDLKPGRSRASNETHAMKGICEDCLSLAKSGEAEPHVRDAALIGAAQHVEHDEMAGYGCARTWADVLGHPKVASMLETTLAEEREADSTLSRLAETINLAARSAGGAKSRPKDGARVEAKPASRTTAKSGASKKI
jgi:ferritin-like metal-binding protein YciE